MTAPVDPDLEYLAPDFDPNSLTMPKLRGILVAHEVPFPSSAKKGQLVEIFNEQVAPQARKILSARARTKRSTKGIVDVPSSQEASVSDDEDERPSRTPRRSIKKTSPTSAAPSSTARKSRKTAHVDVSPQRGSAKVEPDDTPFSAENPFQSGSSPIPAPEAKSPTRRRTQDPDEKKSSRKRSTSRRKTEPVNTETPATSRKKVAVPTSRLVDGDDQVPTGEEFTAEEQQALALERRSRKSQPPRPVKSPGSSASGSFLKAASWAALLAFSGGAATLWRQEKIQVGYCGVGRRSEVVGGVDIPPWVDPARPQCEPCPPHAYCHDSLQVTCEPDFVLVPHPLSLGGVVPLPPTCEPDGDKARKVKAVADRAVEELRERNAQYECGELKDEQGKRATSAEVDSEVLKENVASKRRKGMSHGEFEELWEPAVEEILTRDEIVGVEQGQAIDDSNDNIPDHADNSMDERGGRGRRSEDRFLRRAGRGRYSGSRLTLRSTSLARIPLGCAIRRSVRLTLARHLWQLIAVIVFFVSAIYARYFLASRRATESRAKQLASLALDRLATQAVLHTRDPSRFPESWISMSQLRDDVLRSEFNAKRRAVLWERVQGKVESNSNVRSMVREGRSGDVSRVWEWIGALDWIDSSETSAGTPLANSPPSSRLNGRYSLGVSSTPGGGTPYTHQRNHDPEMEQIRSGSKAWDEGRKAYY